MALVGRQVFVLYDVPGAPLWHERQVLEHVHQELYIVATPDFDVYGEELSLLNSDLRGIRVRPAAGVLPPGILPAQTYPLPAFTPAELANLQVLARAEAQVERVAAGGAAAPAAVANAAPAAVAVAAPVNRVFQSGSLYWLAAEQVDDIGFGDEVPGVAGQLVRGNKTVHTLPSGKSMFVECVDGGDRAEFCQRPSNWDPRTLPLDIDALGRPECSLKETAKKSVEKPMSWVLTGPRTARWCISYLVTEGLGFEAHHERFRQLCRIEASSWGVQEHFQLSMIAKHALQTDQLNGYNSMFCEVIFRRLQTIEFAYAERAREAEAKAIGGRLSLEEQQTFGGLTRQASTLMVCPDLMDYVKTEVERDASLAKNLRKAREEREMSRKQNKSKKPGEDAP